MIVIVGHGPSVAHVRRDIDQDTVIRLRRAEPILGTRTDIICSSQLRYARADCEFWHLAGATMTRCVEALRPFAPSFFKPSTGLSAAILARDRWPDAEIGVAGFDFTLNPERAVNWRHDADAEFHCLMDIGVTDITDGA